MRARAPTVTIVIPTRNRLELLKDAVASAENQTFEDLELVVVDDASEDGTWSWLAGRPEVRAVRLSEHSERCRARNEGLAVGKGRFVLFLDDDDRLLPTAIERLVSGFHRHPNAGAAVGAYVMFDEEGNRLRPTHPRRIVERAAWDDVVFGWVANPSRMLFRTASLRDLGGFQEDLLFSEDWELCLRFSRRVPIVLVPNVVVEYRLHPGQRAPIDGLETIEAVAARHASILDGSERRAFDRIQEVRRLHKQGRQALDDLDARSAFRHFVRAIRAYPAFLWSPITRPELLRPLEKSIVGLGLGKKGTLVARRLIALGRRILRRDVWRSRAAPGDPPA